MKNVVNYDLPEWNAFTEFVTSNGWDWKSSPNADLSRANSRYRAASNVEITFKGFKTDDAAHGHAAILRLAFAYTAAESLTSAISAHSKEFASPQMSKMQIVSEDLSELFRHEQNRKLRDSLQTLLKGDDLKREIKGVEDNKSADVFPIARGVRHLCMHGKFSPGTINYGLGKAKESVSLLIVGLEKALLNESADYFSSWVNRMKSESLVLTK